MNKSLSLLFTKEQLWAIRSHRSLQKSDVSELLMIRANRLQKQAICLDFRMFLTVFPFECPRAHSSRRSSLNPSLKRVTQNDSLNKTGESLFCSFAHTKNERFALETKENSQPWFYSNWTYCDWTEKCRLFTSRIVTNCYENPNQK